MEVVAPRGGRRGGRLCLLLALALPLMAPTCTGPPRVQGLVCRAKTGKIDVLWESLDGAVSYRVHRYEGAGQLLAGEVTEPLFADFGLVDGTTYTYTVTALFADQAQSAPSDPCAATPAPRARDNLPPEITSAPVVAVEAGAAYAYDTEAVDPEGEALIFSLAAAPAGMSIDPASGLVSWLPGPADAGVHTVTVRAADPLGLTAAQPYLLTVIERNQPPSIVSTPPLQARAGEPYAYDVDARDPDGDTLVYSLPLAPPGMTIDPASGLVAWTPELDQVGPFDVSTRATDPDGLFDDQGFVVDVAAAANQTPLVQALLAESARPAQRFAVFFGEDPNRTRDPDVLEDEPVRPFSLPNTTAARERFLRELASDVHVESFEDLPGGLPVTALDFGDVTASLTSDARTRLQPNGTFNGTYPTSGNVFLLSDAGSTGRLSLEFDVAVGAFALAVTDAGESGQLSLTAEHEEGPPTVVEIPHTRDGGPGFSGSAFFFGLITTDRPIVAVEISNDDATVDGFGVDDLVIALPDQVRSGMFEGETASLAPATFSDPETDQTHTATVTWAADPARPGELTEAGGAGTVASSRAFPDDADASVEVCVTDDQGATGCDATPVVVQNLPPRIECSLAGFRLVGVRPDGILVENDPLTGAQTVIADTGLTGWGALDWHPQRGKLYGIVTASTDPRLATLDPATGSVEIVGPVVLDGAQAGFVEGLAFDPHSGGFVAAVSVDPPTPDFSSELLVSLDPDTAIATRIGPLGETSDRTTQLRPGEGDADDIEFVGAQLVAVDAQGGTTFLKSAFVRVDHETGATDIVVRGDPSNLNSLAYDDSTGTLYASQVLGVPALYRVSPSTGTATLVQQGVDPGTLAVVPPADAGQLYGLTLEAELLRIGLSDGRVTNLGSIGEFAHPPIAMTFDAFRGALFTVVDQARGMPTDPAHTPKLVRVDPSSGTSSVVGEIVLEDGTPSTRVEGLDWNPADGRLYASLTTDPTSRATTQIVVLDPSTAVATEVARVESGDFLSERDADAIQWIDGTLYLLDGVTAVTPTRTTLHRLDLATGHAETVGVIGDETADLGADTSAYAESLHTLFVLDESGQRLLSVDPETGTVGERFPLPGAMDALAIGPSLPCSTGGLYAIVGPPRPGGADEEVEGPDRLLLIDVDSGRAREIGDITGSDVNGRDSLTFDPVRGVLFASFRFPPTLVRIDPVSGFATDVGLFSLSTGEDATAVCGLDVNPDDGALYAIFTAEAAQNPCDRLGRVDASTGEITPLATLFQTDPVGDFAQRVDADAIEWIDGALYAVDSHSGGNEALGNTLVYRIDPATGFSDLIGEVGGSGDFLYLFGLAYAEPLGVVFGASSVDDRILSFDLDSFGFQDRFRLRERSYDIAFAIPRAFQGSTTLAEGETSSLTLRFSDPGVLDTHSGTIDWGDGAVELANAVTTRGSGFVGGTHVYRQDGSYEPRVCVQDDDGAEGCTTLGVTVFNAAPEVEPIADQAFPLGQALDVSTSFTDAGRDDTHTVTVDWGDGSVEEVGFAAFPGGGDIATGHTYAAAGDYDASLCVEDDAGDLGCAAFGVFVNAPPAIVSQPPTETVPGAAYAYAVDVADEGGPLAFSLDAAPAGMAIDANGLVSWTPLAGQLGDHLVTVRVEDDLGQPATQSYTVSVVPDVVPPEVSVQVSALRVDPGGAVIVTVTASDNGAPPDVAVTVNGDDLPLDGNGQATLPTDASGALRVVVTVTDAAGNVATQTVAVAVTDPSDTTPPVAALESPDDLAEVTYLEDLVGTASDAENFFRYQLGLARGSDQPFTLLAQGFTPVTSGVLATLDPTLLENGIYRVRLVAEDVNGATAVAERAYRVDGEAKVGVLQLTFTDLTVPLAGIPISIDRTYDSRVKSREDFGVGWSLSIRRGSFEHNRTPGLGWRLDSGGPGPIPLPCLDVVETASHLTEVRLSDRESYQFAMRLADPFAVSGGCQADVEFEQVDGTLPGATLEPLDGALVLEFGANEVVDPLTLLPYDPRRVRLTTVDGRSFDFDRDAGGLTRLVDSVGNEIVIGDDSITHSSGRSIAFERDALGRIERITDPRGNEIRYGYDARGDLISHLDRAGRETTFAYDPRHLLLEIREPSGTTAARYEYDADGRLVALVDGRGERLELAHDLAARQTTQTDALGHVMVRSFDARGNVTRIEQPVTIEGSAVVATSLFEYDADGNETLRVDADGLRSEASFDALGNVLEFVEDPAGLALTTSLTYDARGELLSETDPNGDAYLFEPDTQGLVRRWTDASGEATDLDYGAAGLPTLRVGPAGDSSEMVYDAEGHLEELRDLEDGGLLRRRTFGYDANGNRLSETVFRTIDGVETPVTTRFEYDALDRLVAVTDAEGGVSRIEYDARGLVAARIDALGRRTGFGYDEAGTLTRVDLPDGSFETREYDAVGNLVAMTDRAGRTTRYEYDELGRRVLTRLPGGEELRLVYSPAGRLAAEIDVLGNRTDVEYDGAGRLARVLQPEVIDGRTGAPLRPEWRFEYDGVGTRTAVVDPLGRRTEFTPDFAARTQATLQPDGATSLSRFDAGGRIVQAEDAEGNVTDYAYDALGRLLSVSLPSPDPGEPRPVTRFEYDERGNLLAQTDALGRTTRWEYDLLDRVVSQTLPSGRERTMGYDPVGNRTSLTDFDGRTTLYEYDAMNRLLRRQLPDGSEHRFAYESDGRRRSFSDERGLTGFEYDAEGRLQRVTHPSGFELGYGYDARGKVVELAAPSGTTFYAYDALGRLESAVAPSGVTGYAYDPAGAVVSVVAANGVATTMQRDLRGRPVLVDHRDAADTLLASYAYTYSPAGRRSSMTELDGSVETYGYDALGRLVSELRTGTAPHTRLHEYDAVGNRTRLVADGVETLFSYDVDDRLVTGGAAVYSYDERGNLVRRAEGGSAVDYGWSPDDRLVSVDGPAGAVDFVYDADGRLVGRQTAADRIDYLVDVQSPTGFDQVLEERDAAGGLLAAHTWGAGLLASQLGADTRYAQADAHGSVRLLTDASGAVTDRYTYDGYGEMTAVSGESPNRYGFSGERFEPEAGLQALRARWYDPSLGRFQSRDPFPGVQARPVSLHRYQYAEQDPIRRSDPTGATSLIELDVAEAIDNILSTLNLIEKGTKICRYKALAEQFPVAVGLARLAHQIGFLSGTEFDLDAGKGVAGVDVGTAVSIFSAKFENPAVLRTDRGRVKGTRSGALRRLKEASIKLTKPAGDTGLVFEGAVASTSGGSGKVEAAFDSHGFKSLKVFGSIGFPIITTEVCGLPAVEISQKLIGNVGFDGLQESAGLTGGVTARLQADFLGGVGEVKLNWVQLTPKSGTALPGFGNFQLY
jgi:RHS repeat-associated protein